MATSFELATIASGLPGPSAPEPRRARVARRYTAGEVATALSDLIAELRRPECGHGRGGIFQGQAEGSR